MFEVFIRNLLHRLIKVRKYHMFMPAFCLFLARHGDMIKNTRRLELEKEMYFGCLFAVFIPTWPHMTPEKRYFTADCNIFFDSLAAILKGNI